MREQRRNWLIVTGLAAGFAAVTLGGCTKKAESHCGNNQGNLSCGEDEWCDMCLVEGDGCTVDKPKNSCLFYGPEHCGAQDPGMEQGNEYCATRPGERPFCDLCNEKGDDDADDGCVAKEPSADKCSPDGGGDGGTTDSSGGSGGSSSDDSSGSSTSGSDGGTGTGTGTGTSSDTDSTSTTTTTTTPWCTGHADCTEPGLGYCDTTTGDCVGCLEDDHCTEAGAAACNTTTNECEPCSLDDHCASVSGLNVCDGGTCFECTNADDSACDGKVCDTVDRTCTNLDPGSANACDECVADKHCGMGQLCVSMSFEATNVGDYCLWRQDAPNGPNGSCNTEPPYASTEPMTTSIDGVMTTVCGLRLTTCPAFSDSRIPKACGGAGDDDACGVPGLADGLCETQDSVSYWCTIPCANGNDCLGGISCAGGGYCEV